MPLIRKARRLDINTSFICEACEKDRVFLEFWLAYKDKEERWHRLCKKCVREWGKTLLEFVGGG